MARLWPFVRSLLIDDHRYDTLMQQEELDVAWRSHHSITWYHSAFTQFEEEKWASKPVSLCSAILLGFLLLYLARYSIYTVLYLPDSLF